jgi:hypothetical protein
MNVPSQEQSVVIQNIQNGDNVVVDACAGSGKSTTILSCAVAMPDKNFLQMTYNSALREEVIAKTNEYNITNIEVHTYHSFAVKYYLRTAHTDTGIRHILDNEFESISPIPRFDVIVSDESQDMTLLYYRFILYFTKKWTNLFQILILGDWMQGLYEFKGADIRFLTLGEQIWAGYTKLKNQVFHHCTLRVSYRITKPMASFVNNVMLGEVRLVALKDGTNVIYIRNSPHNIERVVVYQIRRLLEYGELPNEMFILGGSVNGPNSNIRRIENALVESGIPTHVPIMDASDKMDERVIQGKVVFSSFHTVKGRQRKHVFVVGFDNSYFTYYARNLSSVICPNTLYVACTRATDSLYLLENDQFSTDKPLDFLHKTHIQMKNECSDYIDFKGNPRSIFYERSGSIVGELEPSEKQLNVHQTTPSKIIKFLPESVIEELSPIIDRIFVPLLKESELFDIPVVVKTKKGFYEDVSDLNGIAIPNIYYDHLGSGNESHNTVLYDIIQDKIQEMKPNEHLFLKQMFRQISPLSKEPENYLRMANMYQSVQERLYYKLKQIELDEYTWLTPEIIDLCKQRLDSVIGPDCVLGPPEFEKTIIHNMMEFEHVRIDQALSDISSITNSKFRFTARIDLITYYSVWELKCTTRITVDHFIQVIIYAWIWKTIYAGTAHENKSFKIFNIKTGELFELCVSKQELDSIMKTILIGKYGKLPILTDEQFIQKCRSYM